MEDSGHLGPLVQIFMSLQATKGLSADVQMEAPEERLSSFIKSSLKAHYSRVKNNVFEQCAIQEEEGAGSQPRPLVSFAWRGLNRLDCHLLGLGHGIPTGRSPVGARTRCRNDRCRPRRRCRAGREPFTPMERLKEFVDVLQGAGPHNVDYIPTRWP